VIVGVVGIGVVGGTVAGSFKEMGVPVRAYDRYIPIGVPEVLKPCDVVFVCVPTPRGYEGRHDVSAVWDAVQEIEPHLADGVVIGIKSTVSPGTSDHLSAQFERFEFASVPEFLVAARPAQTFVRPDRVIIGAHTPATATTLTKLMALVAPSAPILVLSPVEAELAKLASNAMLAAKVTLANELAAVCSSFGARWPRVQSAVGMDRRIGPDHMTVSYPGGFGGGCLPKDLDGLIASSEQAGYEPDVLKAIAEFNRQISSIHHNDIDLPSNGDRVVDLRPVGESS
jgi:UDPglucose 6-dehydrogenase